jgi:cobalt-zinc-cadmium efflux system protein
MTHDAHGHTEHGHALSAGADRRYLMITLGLLGGFMLAEIVIGLLAGSLGLIADTDHMLTDADCIDH